MTVTAKMVKELRDRTGAGMMDCKNALVETNGDIEKAIELLREKGIAKAAKKAARIAAEGLCNIVVDRNTAYIYEVNSETDFVAKNELFLTLVDNIGKALLDNQPDTLDDALKATANGKTIENLIVEATSTIGEKITLRRIDKLTKAEGQLFGVYKHMGGRIASLVLIEGGNEDVAKDVAMHVAASNPLFLNMDTVDPEKAAHEREMLKREFENELAEETNEKAKEAKLKRIDQIVDGKLKKWYNETVLLLQPFVKDPDLTVEKYVNANGAKVLAFYRYEVGEGIEKAQDDFVAEVMAQVRG